MTWQLPMLTQQAEACSFSGKHKGGVSTLAGHTYRWKVLSKPCYPGAQDKLTPVNHAATTFFQEVPSAQTKLAWEFNPYTTSGVQFTLQ